MSLTRLKPTGVNNTAQFNMANLSVQGNITTGNLKTDNLLYANGVAWDLQQAAGASSQIQFNNNNNFDASANLTFNKSTKTLTTDSIVGNVTGNLTGTILTASQPQITNVGTLSSLSVTGDSSVGGNATVGGNMTITGNLTVSGTTTTINSTAIEIADASLVLARNAATPVQANGAGIIINGAGANLTYNSTSNALVSTHKISADGSLLSALNGSNVTGRVANANVAYTVANAAQPNITSVGTLTGLVVNGDINAQVVSAPILAGTLADTSNSQPNITTVGTLIDLAVAGNITATKVTATTFIGALTGNATTAGTVVTAMQPNITSVGTLLNTTMGSTNSFTGGNLVSATYLTGTLTASASSQPNITSVGTLLNTTMGSTNSFTGGNLVSATYLTGTLTASASSQPNITSVGTLTSLTASGNVTAAEFHGNTQLVLNSTSGAGEGTQIVMAWKGVTGLTGQGSNSWNMDVDSSNNFRLFSVDASGTARVSMTATQGSTDVSFSGNTSIAGWFTSSQAQEGFVDIGSATYSSPVTHNLSLGATFYHTTTSTNFTANFTNVPTSSGKSTVVTLIIVQGGSAYVPTAVQIDGVAQTIKWASGAAPSGTPNAVDFITFAFIRTSSGWAQVLGSATSFI